jgi:hypothetical protein
MEGDAEIAFLLLRASQAHNDTNRLIKNTRTSSFRSEVDMNLREAKLRQKFMTAAAAALALVMSVQAGFGQAAQKSWKDGEYDLANAAIADTNLQTKLQKLDAWKAKFPVTDFSAERSQYYLQTYQGLNRPADVYVTGKEILAKDADNLAALNALMQFVFRFNPPSAADLTTGEQACSALVSNSDKYFSSDKKPQGVTDDQWTAAKKDVVVTAQTCLAWVPFQRKEWEKSEGEYVKLLQIQPANGQSSYQLANAILKQGKVDKLPTMIFHLARAAYYDGPGALSEKDRAPIKAYLDKQYINYHGDKSDEDKVIEVAKANALPPSDFKIKSVIEITKEKDAAEQAIRDKDPAGAFWKTIRDALLADGGQAYFDSGVKGAALPGGANGVTKFKGKLVSAKPDLNPKELVLGITDPKVGEVTLKLDAALRGKMEPGADIEFEGVALSFTKEPFMVTFEVEKAKLTGWAGVGGAPAPGAKKAVAPVRKK